MSLTGLSRKMAHHRGVRSMSQLLNTQQRLKRRLERLEALIDLHKKRIEATLDMQKLAKLKPPVVARSLASAAPKRPRPIKDKSSD